MNEILSHISFFVIDTDTVTTIPFPEYASTDNTVEVSSSKLKSFIASVFDITEKGHCLVLTESEKVCHLLLTMNDTLQSGKVAVYCQNTLYADTVLAEIEHMEKTVHTADGTAYFPETPMGCDLYTTTDNRILCMNSTVSAIGETLYNYTNTVCGTLLPEKFTLSNCIGWLSDCVSSLSIRDKAAVCKSALSNPTPIDHVLVFKNEHSVYAVPIHMEKDKTPSVIDFVWTVFTGISVDKVEDVTAVITDSCIVDNIPNTLLEDVTLAYYSAFYPDKPNPDINTDELVNYTLDRILMIYE